MVELSWDLLSSGVKGSDLIFDKIISSRTCRSPIDERDEHSSLQSVDYLLMYMFLANDFQTGKENIYFYVD